MVAARPDSAFHKSGMFRMVGAIFANTNLSVGYSSDAQEVALCGVLKNIYSVALGIIGAMKLGNDTIGLLAAAALKEMSAVVSALGGKPETAYGAAGAGDFIATGFSEYSKNRRAGEEIIREGVCATKSEGCVSIEPFMKRLAAEKIDAPPRL